MILYTTKIYELMISVIVFSYDMKKKSTKDIS